LSWQNSSGEEKSPGKHRQQRPSHSLLGIHTDPEDTKVFAFSYHSSKTK
jgi:hypothetical protein